MLTLHDLQRRADDYLKQTYSEHEFRESLKAFAGRYSTHNELNRMAMMLREAGKALHDERGAARAITVDDVDTMVNAAQKSLKVARSANGQPHPGALAMTQSLEAALTAARNALNGRDGPKDATETPAGER